MTTAAFFRKSCAALVAALVLASCSRKEDEIPVPDGPYVFIIGDSATRTVLDSDETGIFSRWESGDRIGTFISGSHAYANVTPGPPVSFSIYRKGGFSGGEAVRAYYPHNSNTTSESSVQFEIPVSQSQGTSGFDFDAMPMVSGTYIVPGKVTTNNTPVGELYFRNLAAVAQWRIFSTNSTYASEVVQSVKFEANTALAGPFTANISAMDTDDGSTLVISGYSEKSVTTTLSGTFKPGSSLSSATSVYMVVAPGSYSGTVIVTTDKAEYRYTVSSALEFHRSVTKGIGVNLATCTDRRSSTVETLPYYFGCIEVPALNLGTIEIGDEVVGTEHWYASTLTSGNIRVATHTYKYNGKVYRNFTSCMDGSKNCALWTAQPMHGKAYPDNNTGRGSFKDSKSYDAAFPTEWQTDGYGSSNYSRGHLCASADRQTSDDQNQQTFYYTNQAPQWQNSFNGGIWSTLEGAVQSKAASLTGRDTLYVVSGTLFEGTAKTITAKNGVVSALPSHFYKLIMLCSFNTSGGITAASGAAYVYTNEAHKGASLSDSAYKTTIDAIEARAGFDFFPAVPEALQNAAESVFSDIL